MNEIHIHIQDNGAGLMAAFHVLYIRFHGGTLQYYIHSGCICFGILQVGPGPGIHEVPYRSGVLPFYGHSAADDLWQGKKQAAGITQDTQVAIDDKGLHIRVGNDTSDLLWKSVKRISRKPAMIIIFSDTTHGFIFTNRVLGNEKEEFYRYAASRVEGRTGNN